MIKQFQIVPGTDDHFAHIIVLDNLGRLWSASLKSTLVDDPLDDTRTLDWEQFNTPFRGPKSHGGK